MDLNNLEKSTDGTDDLPKWWEDDEACAARVRKARSDSAGFCSKWHEKATEAMRFVAGHQWDDTERAELEEQEKPPAVLNWLSRLINVVCGQQVANRQEITYLGRSKEDHGATQMMTEVARWVRDLGDEEYEESQAFRDLIVTGMGWTVRRMEYDEDPEGKIIKERVDPRRIRWDPSARRPALADARWIQADYWYTGDELKEIWGPEATEGIKLDANATRIESDSEPHNAQDAWKYEKNSSGIDQRNGEYRVIHHVEWCRHAEYQVVSDDGALMTLSEADFELAKERAEKIGKEVPNHVRRMSRRYYHAWVVGDKVLEKGPALLQTGPQYQSMTGMLDDDTGQFYGLASLGIDPQRFSNAILVSTIHAIKTNAKGGLVAEEDAVNNVKKFEKSWAKADAISWVRPGAVSQGKIQPKTPPLLPPQMAQLMQFLVEAIPNVVGVAPELLAQQNEGTTNQVGMVEELRTQAGLTMLTPWFDSIRLYMKRDGRVLLEMINRFIADGRMARIVGKEGEQYIQLVRADGWDRYDVSVEESTITRDAKHRTFMALSMITPMMAQQGIPPPPSAMDYLPLPDALIQEWKGMIAQKQSQPPEPTEKEKLEKMRVEGAMQLEGVKQQGKLAEVQADAARQTEADASQAAQKERETAAKLQADAVANARKMELAQFEAVLDTRLKTFEAVLKAILEGMQTKQELEQERELTLAQLRVDASRPATGERSQ